MKLSVISTTIACLANASDNSETQSDRHDASFEENMHFLHYVHEHGATFDTTEEFEYRKQLFLKKDAFIRAYNEDLGPDADYWLGHNKFSILTDEEWKAKFAGNEEHMKIIRQDVCTD